MAAMDEFRRLHEIHNRSSRGQKPRKNRDNQIRREKGSISPVSQPDTSTLPSDSSVVIQTPSELPLIPPPPPPPSDGLLTKPPVRVGEEQQKDLLAQLRAQRDLLKKPTQESDSESPNGEKEATSRENDMLQAIKKAMETRRPHLDPDHHTSQNNTPLSDDDDWDN